MINKVLSRRDLFKKTGQMVLVIGAGGALDTILNGCTTIGFKEDTPVFYPPLSGHKISPPINGCYIGFYNYSGSAILEGFFGDNSRIGKSPKIFVMDFPTGRGSTLFPKLWTEKVYSKYGSIPYIHKTMYHSRLYGGFENLLSSNRFAKDLARYAKEINAFRKPLFICTMREMNDTRWNAHYKKYRPWKGKHAKPSYCIKLWQYIWQIFEDNGANEYATWVWSTIPTESTGGKLPRSEKYYPGDKYVDWIGLSAYCKTQYTSMNLPFRSLVGPTYRSMRINHPEKPIMMCELGRTAGSNQYLWFRDAYKTIKSWPGLKAVINMHDPSWAEPINNESFIELKKIFEDSYFIGATKA